MISEESAEEQNSKGCTAIIFEQIVWGFIYLFTYFTIPAGGLKYTKEIFERGYFKCKA